MRAVLLLVLWIAGGTAAADSSARSSWRLRDDFARLDSRWRVVRGTWEACDGAAVARPEPGADGNATLRLARPLRGAVELHLEAHVPEDAEGYAGVHLQFAGRYFYAYVCESGIYPDYVRAPGVLKPGGTAKIRLLRLKGRYELHVDGRCVAAMEAGPSEELDADEISLWAHGTTVRYDNVRVR